MNKKLTLIALVLVFALALSACGCKHETWKDADCETAKTCAECGETEGAPLGHSWLAATCETAKTCEVCGKTDGEALGHAWVYADCETAKTCTNCALTEGEALGHDWQEATTEAPKTCAACSLTEGERIITDPRFTTAATAEFQGKWAFRFTMSGEMMDLDDFEQGIDCILYLELRNDGTSVLYLEAADPETLEKDMAEYLLEMIYAQFAASGISKADADAAVQSNYGMSMEAYVALAVQQMDLPGVLSEMRVENVYYVENGMLYMNETWSNDMGKPSPLVLEGDTLTIEEDLSSLGIREDKMVLTRVVEEE